MQQCSVASPWGLHIEWVTIKMLNTKVTFVNESVWRVKSPSSERQRYMESAVISTTKKSKIFLYSGCLNPLSSKCLPEPFQMAGKPVNKLTCWHWVQQIDKQHKPSYHSSYFAPAWIKYSATNATPECPLCVTAFTEIFFFQFMVQFYSHWSAAGAWADINAKKILPGEMKSCLWWPESCLHGKGKALFCLFVAPVEGKIF